MKFSFLFDFRNVSSVKIFSPAFDSFYNFYDNLTFKKKKIFPNSPHIKMINLDLSSACIGMSVHTHLGVMFGGNSIEPEVFCVSACRLRKRFLLCFTKDEEIESYHTHFTQRDRKALFAKSYH